MAPKPDEVAVAGVSIKINTEPLDIVRPPSQMQANAFVNNAYYNDEHSAAVLGVSDGVKGATDKGSSGSKDVAAGEPDTPHLDFDDLLPHIGEFGVYQKLLFLLMIPFAFSVAFVYFTQIFITLVPEQHWCRVPELEHLSVEDR